MSLATSPVKPEEFDGEGHTFSEIEQESILSELNSILNSPIFQPSKRGQQFLSYVVRHRLEGNHDRLKERTIGVDLFQRPTGYATGDDPVVRVQAGEVRRRLDQYYQANPNTSGVRIELRVGSYTPEFKWMQSGDPAGKPLIPKAPAVSREMAPLADEFVLPESLAAPEKTLAQGRHKRLLWVAAAVCAVVLAGLTPFGASLFRGKAERSILQKFWAPALSSQDPVLICLAKPAVYVPSVKLYQRHAKNPEQFRGQFARLSQKPDLKPDDKLSWSDMVEYPDYGLAGGDVYTAIQLSGFFQQIGKKNQVRIGSDYSFQDLRISPAVVIGAFNNRWSMQMTSNLHFAFVDEDDQSLIREAGTSGRKWYSKTDAAEKDGEDYAVVTRLLNSKTGQFVVIVAGIKSQGTLAAGEFVSSSTALQAAFPSAPPDWEKKNVQVVLQPAVTDGLPSPPQVVAMYVW